MSTQFNHIKPIVGAHYRIAVLPQHGDWSGGVVSVENGPRGGPGMADQYWLRYGPGDYEVDWVDVEMLHHAELLDHGCQYL